MFPKKGSFFQALPHPEKDVFRLEDPHWPSAWVDTLPFWQFWFRCVMCNNKSRLTYLQSRLRKAPAIWTAYLMHRKMDKLKGLCEYMECDSACTKSCNLPLSRWESVLAEALQLIRSLLRTATNAICIKVFFFSVILQPVRHFLYDVRIQPFSSVFFAYLQTWPICGQGENNSC